MRDAGLKATRARIAVLSALDDLDGHPTADDVAGSVAQAGCSVARATVFNVLDDLSRVGLVMRAEAGPGAVRYEAATISHHHFVCNSCGSVTDVPCGDPAGGCVEPGAVAGQIDATQVVFRGTCRGCLDANV